jgi:diacylglycerol O-acyltransferase / wax synthase
VTVADETNERQLRFEDRMRDADALAWSIEKDPMLRSTIIAVLILDQAPDRALVSERLERGSRLVPRLRQRVVTNPWSLAPPRWEVDPYFDLDYHLRWTRAAGTQDMAQVLRVAEPIAMQGFDRDRPLWEMTVVEGLADDEAAVIMKIHHSITDGVGAVKIGMVLFDLERTPPGPAPPLPPVPLVHVLNRVERFADAFGHERRRQAGMARRFPGAVGRALTRLAEDPSHTIEDVGTTVASALRMLRPATTPLSPVMTRRSLSMHFDTITVPLAETKAAAKRGGGKLNDAFVTAAARGLRYYHDKHGATPDKLRMGMPINVRTAETADLAGNQWAPTRFPVPIRVDDPLEHLQVIRGVVAAQRAEPALGLVEPLASVLYRLPTTVLAGIFGSMLKGVDFTASNVPGVPVPVYFAGARVLGQFPLGPLSGSAVNLCLLSYLDQLHIGVNSDPAAVPDPHVLHSCLRSGFEDIAELA